MIAAWGHGKCVNGARAAGRAVGNGAGVRSSLRSQQTTNNTCNSPRRATEQAGSVSMSFYTHATHATHATHGRFIPLLREPAQLNVLCAKLELSAFSQNQRICHA